MQDCDDDESEGDIAQSAKILHPKKRAFLAAFARLGVVGGAAEIAGIERHTHSAWLKTDGPEGDAYREAFEDAKEAACDIMETEARRRAIEGVDKPVFGSLGQNQGSGQVGVVREYSDTLLIFLMKGARPEKYRERTSAEISGPGGKPLESTTIIKTVTHDDWYGNADRLPTPGVAASVARSAIPSPP